MSGLKAHYKKIVLKAVKSKKKRSTRQDIKKWIALTKNCTCNNPEGANSWAEVCNLCRLANNPKNWPKLSSAIKELVDTDVLEEVKGGWKIKASPKKKPKSATKTHKKKKKKKKKGGARRTTRRTRRTTRRSKN